MVATLGHSDDRQISGDINRQIFQAMDGAIDFALAKSLFKRFREQAFATDRGERRRLVQIPARAVFDDFDADAWMQLADQPGNMIRLPQGQLGPA